jgi:hypothetical protein
MMLIDDILKQLVRATTGDRGMCASLEARGLAS